MGPEVLLKGQNGLSDCGTLLAHNRKSLVIGEGCPDLLEISTLVRKWALVQCVNVEIFFSQNLIIKSPLFLVYASFSQTILQINL